MAMHDDASLLATRFSSWLVTLGHASVEKKGECV